MRKAAGPVPAEPSTAPASVIPRRCGRATGQLQSSGTDYDIWGRRLHRIAAPGGPRRERRAPPAPPPSTRSTANWDASVVYDTGLAAPQGRPSPTPAPARPGKLPAPTGLSATLHGFSANLGWGRGPGARRTTRSRSSTTTRAGNYGGHRLSTQLVTGNHGRPAHSSPGGGQYAVRVRSHDPAGALDRLEDLLGPGSGFSRPAGMVKPSAPTVTARLGRLQDPPRLALTLPSRSSTGEGLAVPRRDPPRAPRNRGAAGPAPTSAAPGGRGSPV